MVQGSGVDARAVSPLAEELLEGRTAIDHLQEQLIQARSDLTAERTLSDWLAQELEYDCTTLNGHAALEAHRKAQEGNVQKLHNASAPDMGNHMSVETENPASGRYRKSDDGMMDRSG